MIHVCIMELGGLFPRKFLSRKEIFAFGQRGYDMMKLRRFLAAAVTGVAAASFLGGCGNSIDPDTIDYSVQLLAPNEGDDIAVFETSLGTITAVLYTDEVPTVVQNFKDLVNDGFYDGQVIYQIVPTVGAEMFGSSTEDGNSPTTNTEKPIKAEYSNNLWPFSGSLCALCSEMGQLWKKGYYFDSRSFFISDMPIDDDTLSQMQDNYFPAMMTNAFQEMGGVPGVSQYHTVFGKVIDGMEIVNQINSLPHSEIDMSEEGLSSDEYEQGYTLDEPVTIEKVTLDTFHAADYDELDNTMSQDDYDSMVYTSAEEQAAIDEAISNGTYGQSSEETSGN